MGDPQMTDLGNVAFGLGSSEARNVLQLLPGPSSAFNNSLDSHAILWRGLFFDPSGPFADWMARVDVRNNQQISTFDITTSNSPFLSQLSIGSDGYSRGFSTTKPYVLTLDGVRGGCLKFQDHDNRGYTYCHTRSGALLCSTNPCDQ